MKKFLVLGVLFILPIVAYLFFSSGVNNFAKLPVLTKDVLDVSQFQTLKGDTVTLKNKITVLSVYGSDIDAKAGSAFNLNEKIYDKNYNFEDFQFVVIAEDGFQDQAKALLRELGTTIDVKKWNFVFGTTSQINQFYSSLGTNIKLNSNSATDYCFIIDKNMSLRGRPAEGDEPVRYGYNTASVADLTNAMTDDIKVILAEYRLALKKYNKNDALK
ncbi:hypothetical protein SAMN04488096_105284 [Mesonia phycicola]|uniref:Uncharacterized protein n=1 Tax=Mesonia phycicola TaxID=579105 RepID=A0A1M6EVH0_9FLAO|nr:hypothetical protein [Mesonia phycicola]SHI89467.1 hypothetical protein SAMN04488096_105284 [Mesonia phycicola]